MFHETDVLTYAQKVEYIQCIKIIYFQNYINTFKIKYLTRMRKRESEMEIMQLCLCTAKMHTCT